MINWDLYAKQLQHKGMTSRDRIISREKEALITQFEKVPSAKNTLVDGELKKMIVSSTQALNEKTFVLMPGDTIKIGDIVVWENLHWLVVELDFDNTIAYKGRIAQCNRQIRWQNPATKDIIERWCLMTKPYTSNVTNGTQISVSNREYKVQIPYDDETKLVDLDKRFMLELINGKPRTYSCTSVDQQTNVYQDLENGFIVWNLSQDEACHPNDNIDLMVCDYVQSNEGQENPNIYTISGMDILRAGLGTFLYTLTPSVEGQNNIAWNYSVQTDKHEFVHMEQNADNSVLLSAESQAIGAIIELYVTDRLGEEIARKSIEVVDVYG
ncbi:hypothetical protein B5G34_00730 [Flavonifractor sp. An82]|uniref:hypothetical protein n=1 Tax=Flavonifractor sp. An82 TaxID=1965660 RepID=UPI000B383910|nr:hypothetical protein [Flavonifractor sp. An82]OUN23653.1 hypothetical protein B5G34_00730 [Flavonifractor sp. An82]